MVEKEALLILEGHLLRRRRHRRDTTGMKTIRGLSRATLQYLELLRGMGLRHGDSINAAMDAFMVALRESGELGSDFRTKVLVLQRNYPPTHRALGQTLHNTKQQLTQRQRIRDYLAKVKNKKMSRKNAADQKQ